MKSKDGLEILIEELGAKTVLVMYLHRKIKLRTSLFFFIHITSSKENFIPVFYLLLMKLEISKKD